MSVAARTGSGSRTAPFGLLGDERLARLAAAGHEGAFAVVYERHHQALYRYCRSIVRDDVDAQDALQSTFTAAFAALARGRRDAPIRPWLYRIAHNEAVSTLRRRRPTTELSAAMDDGTTSVEDQVAERADLELLLDDLRELHERQRSALVMRELSGLSHEEIALALETSVGAAKQAIYEARRSLFEFAEGRAMPCDEIRRTISDADGRILRSRRVRAHLRDCPGCAAFAAAIPARRSGLRALVPPLPATAAAGLVERAVGAGARHGAGVGAGHGAGLGAGHGAGSSLAGLAAGGAGKATGAALAANALAGVAVVATATVGVTIGVDKLAQATRHAHPARTATPATTAPATAPPAPLPLHRAPLLFTRPRAPRGDGPPAGGSRPQRRHPERRIPHRGPRARLLAEPGPRTRTRNPSPAPAAPGASTTATTTAQVNGSGATSPGKSAAAPGHTTATSTSPGKSGAAPGHTTATSTSPGKSGAAPGHTAAPATSPGNSGAAPGHTTATSSAPETPAPHPASRPRPLPHPETPPRPPAT